MAAEQEAWENEAKLHRVTVTEDDVAQVVAMMTGVPVRRIAQDESETRSTPPAHHWKSNRTNEAVAKVVKAIQRNRAGLKDPNKPIGSFIFGTNRCWKNTEWPKYWPCFYLTQTMPWCGST